MSLRPILIKNLALTYPDQDFLPFTDVEESVREDMAILRQSPLIPKDVIISGAVYDVDTGRMTQVFPLISKKFSRHDYLLFIIQCKKTQATKIC